jgi:hypothetical protein
MRVHLTAFDDRKRSLGLSIRMRALLSLGEADRDRRASCRFYTKSARPPEAFRADCIRWQNVGICRFSI